MKVAFVATFSGGLGMWRSWSVEKWLDKLGLAEVRHVRPGEGALWWTREQKQAPTDQCMEEVFSWADVIAIQRIETLEHLAYTRGMRDHFKRKMVMDIDDDVKTIEPDNPAYHILKREIKDTIQVSPVPLTEGSSR